MAATGGKLEGQITVPTGGWTATVGGGTATIAAGTYYWSSADSAANDFATTIANAFTASAGFAVSVSTANHGEAGSGIIALSAGSSFGVTWISTDLRDLMGFTGNLSSGTSHTATKAVRSLWIPEQPKWALSALKTFKGRPRVDKRQTSNAAGYVWTFVGQTHVRYPLRYDKLSKSRIWIVEETTANQSWERFWRDTVSAEVAWCVNPAKIRFYPDASDDATYGTYWIMDKAICDPERVDQGWDGLYSLDLGELVGLDQ